jgi:hypothetical protein
MSLGEEALLANPACPAAFTQALHGVYSTPTAIEIEVMEVT